MSFISDLNSAIEYIEEHVTGEIDINMVAHKMKCSVYHFQRMFSSITGIPFSEYIRKRKMTLAAIELQNSGEKIIDIALKYGYDSHSSFTRAFQAIQGIPPSKARIEGVSLTAYPPLSFQFTIKGVESMQYRIAETQPYKVFGTDIVQTDGWTSEQFIENADRIVNNGSHDAINIAAGFPGITREMIEQHTWDAEKVHLLQAITFWDEAGDRFFMYGWEVPDTGVNNSFNILEVPSTTWVVVTVPIDGDRSAISKCYIDLFTNWFPTSGYEQASGRPVIEKYEGNNAELWMPITKSRKL